jgi:hypothetical protein
MTNIDEEVDRKMKEAYQPLSADFDPSVLNDPVAMLTKWEPCERSSQSRKAVRRGKHRIEFRSTSGTLLLLGAFLLLGVALFLGGVYVLVSGPREKLVASIFVALLGLAVAGGVFAALFGQLTPAVFDLRQGCYYRGRRKPEQTIKPTERKDYVTLDRIHALQIIELHHFSKSRRYEPKGYLVYELNLVLEDGARIRVADRKDANALRRDARTLSKFLGKPLWDATV